ncbi:hypothetical protein SAY86_005380 [Trapa natans]|uniref:RING-CH-type domain-containing protein n=1 Tax=Trapa natans TaxID=22666 RepID=A0AAN7L932_TRANT|nr:hypothetical protein SAY86_005380 [Trapa natans]
MSITALSQRTASSSAKEQRSSFSSPECSGVAAAAAPLDLESGSHEGHPCSGKYERDCRICHLSSGEADPDEERGADNAMIELGCSCKDDLATVHRHCAEAWFKIRGTRICEICGSTAHHVSISCECDVESIEAAETVTGPLVNLPAGPPRFWQGHRFLNFVLGCVIFAFIISWLFHLDVPS